MKIDFVMPWVDGDDPEWRAQRDAFLPESDKKQAHPSRFRDWDMLRFWFRGAERFAPWVNRVHFVTWGHLPPWLNASAEKLHIVRHEDYIPKEYLPTFSSHVIEHNFHRIDGLSERFVYFNDDMFLIRPVGENVFFKGGLPCSQARLSCVLPNKDDIAYFVMNDTAVINALFDKNSAIKRNFFKWFSPKYSLGDMLKTLLLMPFPSFRGFSYLHRPEAYLKSTFDTIWEKEYEILDATCRNKFRDPRDVNQYLYLFWQIASGQFVPKRGDSLYSNLDSKTETENFCAAIKAQKTSMVCANDTSLVKDFEDAKALLIAAFNAILPEKSSFET